MALHGRSFNQFTSSESASPSTRQYLPASNDSQGSGLRPYYPVETKWALGLQSRAQPREIMIKVLKALQELNVCWKKNGHYNMKCRWCPVFPQLYKTKDDKYLLDMQRVTRPQLLFLDFCAAFLTNLRVL
ncbi:Carbon catabolite-derepressing protein kinase [Triticum urartu]|uniref:non-specific serine/threonine protein kinase n=1 Tax=Triticum urartu TaxID=4572 RepID=M7ZCP5_TRIUA|nr:Carbon catabolite-derepressing protein kinase [Triticum urartu]